MIQPVRDPAPADYMRHVLPLLEQREAENSLMLALCAACAKGTYDHPVLLRVTDDRGATLTAALQTPPHNLILTFADDDQLRAIARYLIDHNHAIPGVVGPKEEAQKFAGIWAELTGAKTSLATDQMIYKLTRVTPPATPLNGKMIRAEAKHIPLVLAWQTAFVTEALPKAEHEKAQKFLRTEQRVNNGEIFIWTIDDKPVAMAGHGGGTQNGARINAVYTPPEYRKRGYASALVAALSQHILDNGKTLCFLNTNLLNPTSNVIYQRIGYQPVCGSQNYVFMNL